MVYKCSVCGYIVTDGPIPDRCPICDAPKEVFEAQAEGKGKEGPDIDGYRCLNCDYEVSGMALPDTCPVCGVDKELFEPIHRQAEAYTSMDYKQVVIIGSGIAAFSAAETLREMNDKVDISLITNESELTYYRLNLTRYLAGQVAERDLYMHQQYWYDDKRFKVFRNQVITQIDRDKQVVLTSDGMSLTYDKLLLATGAHAFLPPISGSPQAGIYSLRTIKDAEAIKAAISPGTSVAIIGGGVLGLETAGALSAIEAKVQVLEGHGYLMPRQLNKEAAAYVAQDLESKGVEVIYDFRTESIEKVDQDFTLHGSDQRTIKAQVIVLATGVRPNTYIARMAGLEVNRGLVVNDYMQTSDPNIYGAGDLTEHYGITYGLWNIASYQGKIAASNILGKVTSFGGVPRSNVLKVLDVDVFSIGDISPTDGGYRVLEKAEDHRYLMLNLKDQVVVGSIAIGYEDAAFKIKQMVEEGQVMTVQDIEWIISHHILR